MGKKNNDYDNYAEIPILHTLLHDEIPIVPSGERLHSYLESPLMGKSTISIVILSSRLLVYQRVTSIHHH